MVRVTVSAWQVQDSITPAVASAHTNERMAFRAGNVNREKENKKARAGRESERASERMYEYEERDREEE